MPFLYIKVLPCLLSILIRKCGLVKSHWQSSLVPNPERHKPSSLAPGPTERFCSLLKFILIAQEIWQFPSHQHLSLYVFWITSCFARLEWVSQQSDRSAWWAMNCFPIPEIHPTANLFFCTRGRICHIQAFPWISYLCLVAFPFRLDAHLSDSINRLRKGLMFSIYYLWSLPIAVRQGTYCSFSLCLEPLCWMDYLIH